MFRFCKVSSRVSIQCGVGIRLCGCCMNDVAGLTRRGPSVVAEYNVHSQQTQSFARNDDEDYGISTSRT